MTRRVLRLVLAPLLVAAVGCFAEPPSTNGGGGSSGPAATTGEATGDASSSSSDSDSDDDGEDESGDDDSSSGGDRLDVVHLYLTEERYDGNFTDASASMGEGIAAWVDTECANTTAFLANDCEFAFAMVDLEEFPLLTALPDGPFAANEVLIAMTSGDLVLGDLEMSLADAGLAPEESDFFWTGLGETDCMQWTTSEGAEGAVGNVTMVGEDWLDGESSDCGVRLPLLCACWNE